MFVGHYGFSFAAKAADRSLPLWLLFLAAQLVDVFWGLFVPLGIERVEIVPGITESNAYDLIYIPFTHSLPAALLWSLAAAVAFALWRGGNRRSAVWIGLTVLSHWCFDLIVHLPDLPLWGDSHKVGFGLWMHRWPSFTLEALLLFGGMACYFRSAHPPARERLEVIGFGIFMLALQAATLYMPPPATATVAALQALFAYALFAFVAWRLERSRASRPKPSATLLD